MLMFVASLLIQTSFALKPAEVSFVSPKDGATVTSPVKVKMAVVGKK